MFLRMIHEEPTASLIDGLYGGRRIMEGQDGEGFMLTE
jgi:hypothetical protein